MRSAIVILHVFEITEFTVHSIKDKKKHSPKGLKCKRETLESLLSLAVLADSCISNLQWLHINLSQTQNGYIPFVLLFKLDWPIFSSFLSWAVLKVAKFQESNNLQKWCGSNQGGETQKKGPHNHFSHTVSKRVQKPTRN